MSMTDSPARPPFDLPTADAGPSPWQDETAPRLTVADVARWAKCCEQTVRRAIHAGDLTASRWGKEYRMSPAHVREWYATKLTQKAEQSPRDRLKVLRSIPRRLRS